MTRTIVTLMLILCLLGNAGCQTTRPAAADLSLQREDARSLRVMSFNLRRPVVFDLWNAWGFRKYAVVDAIRSVDADLVGTQECVASQARFLEKQLPEYAWVGAGRNDGKTSGEMCAVFYRRERFELLDSGHFWLSDTPETPASRTWGNWWPRMVTWVKLRDLRSGQPLVMLNTHFDVFSENARQRSAMLLAERIETLAPREAVIVTGDFNTGEGSVTHITLAQHALLSDTYRAAHPQRATDEGTHHSFTGKSEGDRIDWVLACDRLQTQSSAILRKNITGRLVSDHYPVLTELRWLPTRAPIAAASNP